MLASAPFTALLDASRMSEHYVAELDNPEENKELWEEAHQALLPKSETHKLPSIVTECAEEAARRIAHACWSAVDRRHRASALSILAEALFGTKDTVGRKALQGLLLVRGATDMFLSWWPERRAPDAPTFRLHTFFRSIEGLFGAISDQRNVPHEYRSNSRILGRLGVDRGQKFEGASNGQVGNRIMELVYCECCGELLIAGSKGEDPEGGYIELLPCEPELEGLPDSATQQFFEDLTAEEFAIFWPTEKNQNFWPNTKRVPKKPKAGTWKKAYYDPRSGRVKFLMASGSAPNGQIRGFIFIRGLEFKDSKGRKGTSPGTAVPFECPSCDSDYSGRALGYRLSPIRNFRAGFAKTTQLLATELFGLLRIQDPSSKIVSFSDSRQDAAHAALEIESRHHQDLWRELLVKELRKVAHSRPSMEEIKELIKDAKKRLIDASNAGKTKEVIEIAKELDILGKKEESAGRDEIPLSEVIESPNDPIFFGTIDDGRAPLKPLLYGFVELGVHPVSPTGVARIKAESNTRYKWEELFTIRDNVGPDWHDASVEKTQIDLNTARHRLVSQAQKLICEVVFNKTYFSLEETGLGYPCVPDDFTPERKAVLDAFVRVLGDAYRLTDNPWAKGPAEMPAEWSSAEDIGERNRVRTFARAIWSDEERVNEELNKVLQDLSSKGHKRGYISTSALCACLTDESDPYWRCPSCGRVHLHLGAKVCTRCQVPLNETPDGKAEELRRRSFLAKRIERDDQIFRLRCEELTGQTDDPADRQRRFKGILIEEDIDSLLERSAALIRYTLFAPCFPFYPSFGAVLWFKNRFARKEKISHLLFKIQTWPLCTYLITGQGLPFSCAVDNAGL
jgi:hypothetical protein